LRTGRSRAGYPGEFEVIEITDLAAATPARERPPASPDGDQHRRGLWRDHSDAEYCDADLYQLLYRDDGVVLRLVMRLRGGDDTDAYVYTAAHDALRCLGTCSSDDAARGAVERAVGTDEGVLCPESRPERS
jgi:hypothetical protein